MIIAGFLTSAISVDKRIEIGENAPKIETISGEDVIKDERTDGKMKLISFWNPKKPESRITNKSLYQQFGANSDSQIELISICTDPDEALMKEVMKIDGLKDNNNYSYSQISSRVFKDYGADENPKAYMISAEGKILSIM